MVSLRAYAAHSETGSEDLVKTISPCSESIRMWSPGWNAPSSIMDNRWKRRVAGRGGFATPVVTPQLIDVV